MVPIIILLEFPNFRLFKQKPHFTLSTRFVYRNPIYHTSYFEIIEVDEEISFRNPLEKSFLELIKGSSDPSHFIFETNVGTRRIRHRTTLNLE